MPKPSRQALKCKAKNSLTVRGQAEQHTAAEDSGTVARQKEQVGALPPEGSCPQSREDSGSAFSTFLDH